jgi:hypothetical protein
MKVNPAGWLALRGPDHTSRRSPRPITSPRNLDDQRQAAAIDDVAKAPAGSANTNIGNVDATWTSATISGLEARPVINQDAAAFCIQVPILATTVAIHRTAKAQCRSGPSDEPSCAGAGGG